MNAILVTGATGNVGRPAESFAEGVAAHRQLFTFEAA